MALSILSSVNSNITKYSNSATANRPSSTNLIYYYKFINSDISGNTLKNYAPSKNSYDAQLNTSSTSTGFISATSKWSGRQAMWANLGQWGFYTTTQPTNFSNTWSFSYWMLSGASTGQYHIGDPFCFSVPGGNNTTSGGTFLYEFGTTTTSPYYVNHLYVYGTAGGNYFINGTSAYSINAWTHFCFVSNSSSSTLYINGVSVYTLNSSYGPMNFNASSKLWFGIGGNNFDCYLDEMRIYNIALSSLQVQTLYNYDGTWI